MEDKMNMKDAVPYLVDYLCNPPESIKIPGMNLFNECVGGFRSSEYTILCGSTGSGKTSWLSQLSAGLLEAKVKHFVMSVENGHLDYLARVVSVLVNEDLNTGDPVPKEKILRIGANLYEQLFTDYIKFSTYDNRIPLEQLVRDLEWAVANECKIVFIDNLNFFMEVTSEKSAVYEMDRVTHELVIFCKRNPIHIVMVMHPKKGFMGTRVLSEYDIKGSSTSVQEANNILLFNRPDPERVRNGDTKYTDRELYIAKLRRRGKYQGRTLVYNGERPRYEEIGYLGTNVVVPVRSENSYKTSRYKPKGLYGTPRDD